MWAAALESTPLELIAIAHVEDDGLVAAFQPSEQVARTPDLLVQVFRPPGLPHFRVSYFGWGTIRR